MKMAPTDGDANRHRPMGRPVFFTGWHRSAAALLAVPFATRLTVYGPSQSSRPSYSPTPPRFGTTAISVTGRNQRPELRTTALGAAPKHRIGFPATPELALAGVEPKCQSLGNISD